MALLGAGLQGRALMSAAQPLPGLRFRAIADLWDRSRRVGASFLKSYDIVVNTYSDYRELLDKEKGLDAALVATPDFVHAEQTDACLRAGLHVYCEKPMASSLDAARSMVQAARQTGKLLQIGYQRRSNPRYLHVAQNVLQKARLIGRLTHVDTQWSHPVAEPAGWPKNSALPDEELRKHGYASMNEFRNWRWSRKHGAGLFADLAAQQVDVANWFLGVLPRSVLAAGGLDYYQGRDGLDNVLAVLEYPAPAGLVRAFCRVLTTTSGSGNAETFIGTDGALRMAEQPKGTKVYREPHAPEWDEWVKLQVVARREDPAAKPLTSEEAHARETGVLVPYELPVVLDKPLHQPHLENFFDAVRGKAKLACPADEAFRTEAVSWKVVEAVEAKKMLPLTPHDFAV